MYFYDTCALINSLETVTLPFAICDVTLQELEDLKTSSKKDEDTKSKVRKVLRFIKEHLDDIEVIRYHESMLSQVFNDYSVNNDAMIISAAAYCHTHIHPVIFRTADVACFLLARETDMPTEFDEDLDKEKYFGYKKLVFEHEDETEQFYCNMLENKYDLIENQYLFIYVNNTIIDKYKWKDGRYQKVNFPCFESRALGKLKPKDEYQFAAMDSLKHNQLTLLRGPAGTGKSYLAMSYLMESLERGIIDKIIVFCNTVATAGAARLGFYPGTRDEKLLDSQIGNFLASKLGGMDAVKKMISDEKLLLLPMSDVRGFDTSGMNAGIYITEAQNMDIDLMKLALQRVGDDSICILDGDDEAQVDAAAYAGARNGMKRVSKIFRGQDFYGEVSLNNIYRSKIARIAQEM